MPASEMTYIVSSGALNSTHSHIYAGLWLAEVWMSVHGALLIDAFVELLRHVFL